MALRKPYLLQSCQHYLDWTAEHAPGETDQPVVEERYAAERERYSESLIEFAKVAWTKVEPLKPLVWGWHIDCLFEHMTAVFNGEIRTLVINIPPGFFKSSSVSIIFPAWCWAAGRPSWRFLTGSYGLELAAGFARKSRMIIESEWYAQRWPEVVLREDQNAKARYENTLGGTRQCFSTGGALTGAHGDIGIWDDQLKAKDAYSPRKREEAIEFMTETLPSRFDDPMRATMILMAQRLHQNDPSGHLLREASENRDRNVVHLCLPAHFDPKRRLQTLWFTDPRKVKGELLWPERFDEKALQFRSKGISPRAFLAQFEQQPNAPGGSVIKRAWWKIWPMRLPAFERRMISFDPAVKDGDDNSYWACTVWGVFVPCDAWDAATAEPPAALGEEPAIMLIGAWRMRCNYPEAKLRLIETIKEFTVDDEPPDWTVIEDKASGPILIEELDRAQIPGIEAYNPGSKSKAERGGIASDLWFCGRVWVPGKKLDDKGSRSSTRWAMWVEEVVAECEAFPMGDTDDYFDSSTQAANWMRQAGEVSIDTDPDEDEVVEEMAREAVYG